MLDTSAALEVVLRRPLAKRFMDRLLKADKDLSSTFFRVEAANVVAKYIKSGNLSAEDGGKAFSFCTDMVDEYVPIEVNATESFNESIRLGHPAYDMLYFTLARKNGAVLLTCDKKLLALCKVERVYCVGKEIAGDQP
ncbi:MAG: type II toxin-antitoxin system VapC family toxin [Clostridiales Family XIII bacterium]|nr:type II toxin-antitoxin system VapC family toxin [Clostridiales Family XIII bacterium]